MQTYQKPTTLSEKAEEIVKEIGQERTREREREKVKVKGRDSKTASASKDTRIEFINNNIRINDMHTT